MVRAAARVLSIGGGSSETQVQSGLSRATAKTPYSSR
jgi:hypothetical protein